MFLRQDIQWPFWRFHQADDGERILGEGKNELKFQRARKAWLGGKDVCCLVSTCAEWREGLLRSLTCRLLSSHVISVFSHHILRNIVV